MKRSTFLWSIGILGLMATVACKDDEAATTTADLLGVWTVTEINRTGCTDDEDNGSVPMECTTETCLQFIFAVDSIAQYYSILTTTGGIEFGESGEFTVNGSTLNLCIEDEDGVTCAPREIHISNSTMTISGTKEETGCHEQFVMVKEETEEEEEG